MLYWIWQAYVMVKDSCGFRAPGALHIEKNWEGNKGEQSLLQNSEIECLKQKHSISECWSILTLKLCSTYVDSTGITTIITEVRASEAKIIYLLWATSNKHCCFFFVFFALLLLLFLLDYFVLLIPEDFYRGFKIQQKFD